MVVGVVFFLHHQADKSKGYVGVDYISMAKPATMSLKKNASIPKSRA